MSIVILFGDALLWLSFCFGLYALWLILKNQELKSKWQKIINNKTALVSLMIFLLYFIIALLDSIHINNPQQSNNLTILDKILILPLKNDEKTYSAPFAFRSFNQSYLADGSRGYPPLRHGGLGIDSIADNIKNITNLIGQALFVWLAVVLVFIVLVKRYKKHYWQQQTIKTMLTTLAVMLLLLLVIGFLLPHYHLFGTDKAGVDVFYKAIKSIRTSLIFGLITTLIATPIAIFFGLLAGYFKGWVDDIIQFFYTTINAMPNILLIAALVVMVQVYMAHNADIFDSAQSRADAKLLLLCLVIALTSWTGLCRIIRAETLKLSQLEFVQAAEVFGLARFKILSKHLLPNVLHLVLISMVLDFSALVLTESVLSYIGIGVDSASFSWGNMINAARLELAKTPVVWWSLGASFLLMFILVLAVNLLADKVREVFDPKSH